MLIDELRWERDFLSRENRMTTALMRFARSCCERAGELSAEAYVAHGVEGLLAANVVAQAVGGRVYCDVIEMPSFAQRSVTYELDPINLALLDHGFGAFLRSAAGISTIGWALKEQIRHYGPPVTVIPNYRYAEKLQPSNYIREKCGLGPEDRLLLANSSICGGFEPIVEALRLLPDNVHLATLGNIADPGHVHALPAHFGVATRVHFFDPVPYEQLTTIASGANIGLMVIDPSLINDRISLPNRLFDCIAAGVPVVTPAVPDIARIVREWNIGIAVRDNDPSSWAEAIARALADEAALRANIPAASQALVWDSLGDELHAAYDHAPSVTFIAYCDLIGHQRTIRMVDTLVKRGVKVTVCCPHNGPAPVDEMADANFVFMPSPLHIPSPPKPPETPSKAAEKAPLPNGVATAAETVDGEVIAARSQHAPTPPADAAAGDGDAARRRPEGGAALALKPASPLTRAEQLALERLKKEVMQLRYKARRYDEIKDQVSVWRAKAERWDKRHRDRGRALLRLLWPGLQPDPRNGDEARPAQSDEAIARSGEQAGGR
jgi:glycosyltransferase involved in cell wall biosynthesis